MNSYVMGTVLKYSVVDINSSLGVKLDGFLSVELLLYSDRVSVSVRFPTSVSVLLIVESVVELNVILVVATVVTFSAFVELSVVRISVAANVVNFADGVVVDVVVGFSLKSLSISRADSVEVR